MGHFNKFSAKGGPASGWRDRQKQMFPAVCSKCGNECQVPFRPTGDRPVFCNNCFKTQGGGNDRPRFAPKRFDGGGNRDIGARVSAPDYSAQFASLNAKLDKIISIVETHSNASIQKEKTLRQAQGKVKKKVVGKAKTKKK
jgi:CxxC-x17-CxxC domain-containing protein